MTTWFTSAKMVFGQNIEDRKAFRESKAKKEIKVIKVIKATQELLVHKDLQVRL